MTLAIGIFVIILSALLLISGLFMLVRDLLRRRRLTLARRLSPKGQEPGEKKLKLRGEEVEPRSVTGKWRKWFDRLVGDSGWDTSGPKMRVLHLALATLAGAVPLLLFNSVSGAVMGFLLGYFLLLPLWMYRRVQQRRLMEDQLPESVYLLARAVRAGESVDQAVLLVARETPKPLGLEFQRCAQQLSMGLSMSDTMRLLARRTRIPDVRLFATTLMIHRQTGGNLPQTLERLADVMRNRLDYRRQFRSSTAGGKLSTFIIACAGIGVVAYLTYAKPEYMQRMFESPLGWGMLATVVLLQVMGIGLIYYLVKTDY